MTDPELDMMRELLADDGTDEVFLDVGRELVQRKQWQEAEQVLSAGLAAHNIEEGWALLARAAAHAGQVAGALQALEHLVVSPSESPDLARLEVFALERVGAFERAHDAAEAFLAVHPGDADMQGALLRLDAPPPEGGVHGIDPFLSVERAEQYASLGRIDRAVRVYRRILFRNPQDMGVAQRLQQLQAEPFQRAHTDLSEELTDPGQIPPHLTMPEPALQAVKLGGAADPLLTGVDPLLGEGDAVRTYMDAIHQARQDAMVADEEHTDPMSAEQLEEAQRLAAIKARGQIGTTARKGARRRRRSLLRRG